MLATASQLQEIIYRCDAKYPKFIRVNENWGFKMWHGNFFQCHYEQDMRNNWYMQNYAASYGIAPAVGDIVSIPNPFKPSAMNIWGFFTEICHNILYEMETYKHLWWGWYDDDDEIDFDKYWKKYLNDDNHNSIDFDYYGLPNLIQQLENIGFEYAEDLHSANVGYMKDGRFVCFDFDHCHLPENPITKADKLLMAHSFDLALKPMLLGV